MAFHSCASPHVQSQQGRDDGVSYVDRTAEPKDQDPPRGQACVVAMARSGLMSMYIKPLKEPRRKVFPVPSN